MSLSGMTPAEIWNAVRSVKILGPWEQERSDGRDTFVRKDAAGLPFVRALYSDESRSHGYRVGRAGSFVSPSCDGMDQAMGHADEWLRSEGWSLA